MEAELGDQEALVQHAGERYVGQPQGVQDGEEVWPRAEDHEVGESSSGKHNLRPNLTTTIPGLAHVSDGLQGEQFGAEGGQAGQVGSQDDGKREVLEVKGDGSRAASMREVRKNLERSRKIDMFQPVNQEL